jgi:hypothetical protein
MNKIKKLYKDFFGLTEQSSIPKKVDPTKIVHIKTDVVKKDPKILDTLAAAGKQPEIVSETDLEEAELTNKITDYQGGVQMLFTDPAMAKQTMIDIITWAKKKGFDVITKKMYNTQSGSKAGYIYFRLGEDPYKESQRIQGYISQSPGINKFRFKVKQ